MGEINIDNTGSGAAVTLSSDGSSLLLGGSAIGGGGGASASADLYKANPSSATSPTAAGANSIAIGNGATVGNNGANAISMGQDANATASKALAFGYDAEATSDFTTAFGAAWATASGMYSSAFGMDATATASSSLALGKARANGADSFAASIGSTSTSYGTNTGKGIAIGYMAKCSAGTIALGRNAQATGSGGVAISAGYSNVGPEAKTDAVAIGDKIISTGRGQYAYGIARFAANGDGQGCTYILLASTTDATPTSMTTQGTSPNSLNQVGSNWQVNDTCLTFSGTIVAMQNGCQAYGSWEVKGLLVNDGGTVSVPSSAITVIHNASNWGITIGTDTTGGNNSLKIQVTGEASHNIRWVANIQTSQVTFA